MSIDKSFQAYGDKLLDAVIPKSLPESVPAAEPLPMVGLGNLPRESSLEHRIAAVDGRGRVSDKTLIQLLGWLPSEQVSITLVQESIAVVRRVEGSRCRITPDSYLRLPLAVRRRLSLAAGERVLLVAAPVHNLLVVHHMSTLDEMVLAYHSPLADQGA